MLGFFVRPRPGPADDGLAGLASAREMVHVYTTYNNCENLLCFFFSCTLKGGRVGTVQGLATKLSRGCVDVRVRGIGTI